MAQHPQVMHKTWNGGSPTPEFNNAAQVVNHTFFWESMSPNGGGEHPRSRC
jgi:Fe-Mn family superoxide dismutase